ncbi:glycosyltransferase family 39 protein [Aurantiacibacter spongiae]|uniref:Glycosyltransferase RgtA/B/C/D-like domain-containing protein n=1 Tax=Aurantiacibacter spongiae TaxID=2488860 RepID=A0A3N5DC63_9SPHN|nr:glycosyltransferase family 39 protein [Aurantiacibacter spongiae]RPF72378.1 hypothetical protein EG799_12635 [Aurantiacibacter spongiae]
MEARRGNAMTGPPVAGAPAGGRLVAWMRAPDLIALALVAITVLATRAVWFGDPVADFDEQLYSFIGWRMTHGELPFVDWWDRKPFGLFAIFAAIHALFGPETLAYQGVACVFVLAGSAITYRLARRLADPFASACAAAIYAMLLSAYASYSAQSEVFFTPLILGMAALLADRDHPHFARRSLAAMLLGGFALQIKYTVLPQCAFFGGWALWVSYRRGASNTGLVSQAAVFALAGLAPTLLVAGFYAAIGEFDAFWFANFQSFFDRVAAPQGRWSESHWIGLTPLVVLAAGGVCAALRLRAPHDATLWRYFCGWAVATLGTVLLPGTVYLYYYAALAAPVALVAVPLLDRRTPAGMVPGLVLVSILWTLLAMPARHAQAGAERDATHRMAAAIAPYVGADRNCLFVWDGPTVLYRMTGSCTPSRFVYPDHLNNALETRAIGIDQTAEVARILATRPGAIVTANRPMTLQNPQATALVERALERNYRQDVSVRMNDRTITAWLRRP